MLSAVGLDLLTGAVSFRVLECSPFVRASRKLSASLYTYSSDLARNSGKLSITQVRKNSNYEHRQRELLLCHNNNLVRKTFTTTAESCPPTPTPGTNAPDMQGRIRRAISQECPVTSPRLGLHIPVWALQTGLVSKSRGDEVRLLLTDVPKAGVVGGCVGSVRPVVDVRYCRKGSHQLFSVLENYSPVWRSGHDVSTIYQE